MLYNKDYLISAYMYRFCLAGCDTKLLEDNAKHYYDTVGKEKFRVAASLDAAALKEFNSSNFALEAGIKV